MNRLQSELSVSQEALRAEKERLIALDTELKKMQSSVEEKEGQLSSLS